MSLFIESNSAKYAFSSWMPVIGVNGPSSVSLAWLPSLLQTVDYSILPSSPETRGEGDTEEQLKNIKHFPSPGNWLILKIVQFLGTVLI